MGFWIKYYLGNLLAPVALAGVIGLVGLVLLARERTRRLGMGTLMALVVVGVPLGTTPVADAQIRPLERE